MRRSRPRLRTRARRLALVVAVAAGSPASAQAPDLILHSGEVVTLDDARPRATALAVRGEQIVAVGSDAEVLALIGQHTRLLHLGGRMVVPGLGDNHFHGIGGGPGVDLSGARSLADVARALSARAARSGPGEVIVTNSDWHEGQLREQRLPLRDNLDRAVPDHPVVVVRGGHEYVLNSAALRRWGIDASTPTPEGGRIGRYPDGRLNGELVDRAKALVDLPRERAERDREARIAELVDQHRRLNALGLTSVRYPGASPELWDLLSEMRRRGLLTLRADVLFRLGPVEDEAALERALARLPAPDAGDDRLRVGGIKLGVDGGFEGGWMTEPYAEPWGEGGTYRGLPTFPPERYRWLVRELNERGWRVATHAVGDAALDLVLDAYEAAHRERPITGRRWAIEHAFVARPDQLPRMRALGLALSVQDHLYVAAPSLVAYWGPERAAAVTPVRTYLDAGLHVSSGTDSPVIPENPWATLYHFATRGTLSAGVLDDAEAVGREEALRLATTGYAWLTGREDRAGVLAPGMLADLVVLEQDLFEVPDRALPHVTVARTMVGGRIVHDVQRVDTTAWLRVGGDELPELLARLEATGSRIGPVGADQVVEVARVLAFGGRATFPVFPLEPRGLVHVDVEHEGYVYLRVRGAGPAFDRLAAAHEAARRERLLPLGGGIVLEPGERLADEGGRPPLGLRLSTAYDYNCLGFALDVRSAVHGDTVRVDVLGVSAERGPCPQMMGPAEARVPLPRAPGERVVQVVYGDDTDNYTLLVTDSTVRLAGGRGSFTEADTRTHLRAPVPGFAFHCHVPDDAGGACAGMAAWLDGLPGVRPIPRPPSAVPVFGRANRTGVFAYDDPSAVERIRRCLAALHRRVEPMVGVNLTVQLWDGELITAWSSRSNHEPHEERPASFLPLAGCDVPPSP